MNKFSVLLLPAMIASHCVAAAIPVSDTALKPFPLAAAHMQRHVIMLPALDNEQQHRVELIVGRLTETDCNLSRLAGTFTEETAKGWGYPYYQVTLQPEIISTRMACGSAEKKTTLVTLPAASESLLRYNSKLPLVVYTPENVQVSYRIWQAGEETLPSQIR